MMDFLTAGGPFMFLLVITSLVALTFIIERGWALRWRRVIPAALEAGVENCQGMDNLVRIQQLCRRYASPLGRLLQVGAAHMDWPKPENTDAIQTHARQEIVQLERGLIFLEVVVGVAPLLGLLGTIHGLITLFANLGDASLGDNAVLAKGISIALNTTLAGLLISIPSLIAWSYFTKKVETMAVEMETLCDEFIRRLYRSNREE